MAEIADLIFGRIDRNSDEDFRNKAQALQSRQLDAQIAQFMQSLGLDRERFAEAKSQYGKSFDENQLRANQAQAGIEEVRSSTAAEMIARGMFRPSRIPEANAIKFGGQWVAPVDQDARGARLRSEEAAFTSEQAQKAQQRYFDIVKQYLPANASEMMKFIANVHPAGLPQMLDPKANIAIAMGGILSGDSLDKYKPFIDAISTLNISQETPSTRAAHYGQAAASNAQAAFDTKRSQMLQAPTKESSNLLIQANNLLLERNKSIDYSHPAYPGLMQQQIAMLDAPDNVKAEAYTYINSVLNQQRAPVPGFPDAAEFRRTPVWDVRGVDIPPPSSTPRIPRERDSSEATLFKQLLDNFVSSSLPVSGANFTPDQPLPPDPRFYQSPTSNPNQKISPLNNFETILEFSRKRFADKIKTPARTN
jgi:hypothetical protein